MSEQVPDKEGGKSVSEPSAGDRSRSFAAQANELVKSTDVSNSLTVPIKRAIEELLQLAAQSVGSAVASVLVRDGHGGGLKFLTATSGASDELLALRLPPGKGIAGLVFSTTQPMAIGDVSTDGSFWSEADRRTGFKTIAVLATPLRANGEMVGVLEFVNRPGDPPYPSFTPAEMDSAGRFADIIARLVDEYELAQLIESLFNYSIKAPMVATGPNSREDDLREWLKGSPSAAEHRDFLLLWISLREIVLRGDAERGFCRDLLEMLARFTAKRGF